MIWIWTYKKLAYMTQKSDNNDSILREALPVYSDLHESDWQITSHQPFANTVIKLMLSLFIYLFIYLFICLCIISRMLLW